MDSRPLISVIVPVYNVNMYLKRCLDSIRTQTYQNMNIILVDDGSTDSSGHICDEYANMDNRICTIHKANGGLSSARNVGISASKGEYITFIDSDDFVCNEYMQRLFQLLTDYKADISVMGYQKFTEPSKVNRCDRNLKIRYFTKTAAISNMWYKKNINCSAWGKLYKKSVFEGITFPEGKIFEDLGTTYKLFWQADRIVYSSERLYYYYQRNESIMKKKFDLDKMDRITISENLLEWAGNQNRELQAAATARYFLSNVQVLREIPMTDKYREQLQYISANIKKSRTEVMHDRYAKAEIRVIAFCSLFGIGFLKKLGNLHKKIFK